MNRSLRHALTANDGVIHRRDALRVVNDHVIDWALTSGQLVAVYPSVYVDADRAQEDDVQLRAALRYAGTASALASVTGLRRWGLPVPEAYSTVHVATSAAGTARGRAGLRVHRWASFVDEPPLVVTRNELPVVHLERCLVDAWPRLPAGHQRRAPTIVAIRERRTTVGRVRRALAAVPKLPDRAAFSHLLDLIERGCHSELEVWGHDNVFNIPAFAEAARQLPVRLPSGVLVYLDVAIEDVMVNFELDGRAYHSSPQQHERDLVRDAGVATMGWLPVRFTHQRLMSDTDAVRAEAQAIVDMRRIQLRRAA